MRKWTLALLCVMLFLTLAVPVWADDGEDQVVFFGDRIVIGPGQQTDGGVTVIGGSLELREGSRVRGDVMAIGGESTIDGQIDGNLIVLGGTLDLRSHALVQGDLYTLGASVSRAAGATIGGQEVESFRWRIPAMRNWPRFPLTPEIQRTWRSPYAGLDTLFRGLLRWVARSLALMALGVVLVLLLPKQTALIGQTAYAAPLVSMGVGLLTFVVLLLVVPILVLICIGIPVALVLAIAYVAAGTFGYIALGVLLGQRILAALKVQPQPLLEVIAGIPVLELLSAVPCLGALLRIVVALAGLGAVVLTRFGTMPYQPVSRPAQPPAPLTPPEAPGVSEDQAQN